MFLMAYRNDNLLIHKLIFKCVYCCNDTRGKNSEFKIKNQKILNKNKKMKYNSSSYLKNTHSQIIFLIFSLIYSALAVAVSYGAEYLLALHPCRLCLYQRYGYIAWFVVVCLAGLYSGFKLFSDKKDYKTQNFGHNNESNNNSPSFRFIFILMMIFPLAELVLSIFHMGVEYKLWTFSSSCTNNLSQAKSYTEFQQLLLNADNVMCDTPSTILGIPMTVLNFLYSLFFLVLVSRQKSLKILLN